MSEDLERSQDRLDNIRAIDPILSALRTISMGSWQSALNRLSNVQTYRNQFVDIYNAILPYINARQVNSNEGKIKVRRVYAIIVGSERGLIGKFNRDIAEFSASYLVEQQQKNIGVDFWLLGSRIKRIFSQHHLPYTSFSSLSTTSLPPYRLASDITNELLMLYEKREIDAVDVIYNNYQGSSRYKITVKRIIPFTPDVNQSQVHEPPWPPAIVETDSVSLYTQLVKQETAIHMYGLLLTSAAAEHSARYQLLEEATQNAQRLIEELNLAVQMSRRQAITREMQELAVGAGMLEK